MKVRQYCICSETVRFLKSGKNHLYTEKAMNRKVKSESFTPRK